MMTSRLLPPASSTYMLMSALLISVSSNRYADSKTPSFLLQSNVVVLQSLAKHVIYQTLAPAAADNNEELNQLLNLILSNHLLDKFSFTTSSSSFLKAAHLSGIVRNTITAACWSFLEEVPAGFIIARPSAESLARRQNAVLIQLLRFFSLLIVAFALLLIVMTSSLLLIASSSMYADVITAVSRFLSISNADVNVAARSFLQYMTPSFLLQSNVVVLQSLAKHVIYQTLAPAGYCHRKILLLNLSSADCDDIILAAHCFLQNLSPLYVLTSSLLITALALLLIFDFFQTAMLTSSLLLVDTSSRHADVIIADTSSC
ncbi:hypothetical protein F511_38246 [Dorcoceras hygrometricum]|uniref:Uncharacterized protein n=1 Tax=Dorcoceras hygrometricum TaxID=472368 RepID=A0A2Z7B303_9LAMI|nr:hypothetical protein F511_38246 [Dorcoceras hygrometricum]